MTPKAKELVDKFSIQTYQYQEYPGARYTTDEIGWEAGKKCALIHVNQILKLPVCWYSKEMADRDNEACPYEGTKEHWEQLKAEIEKP